MASPELGDGKIGGEIDDGNDGRHGKRWKMGEMGGGARQEA